MPLLNHFQAPLVDERPWEGFHSYWATVALADPDALYAVAYRSLRVEAWPETLEIGKPLPTLPLWLAEDVVVRVDLEQSYLATCDTLRIPVS